MISYAEKQKVDRTVALEALQRAYRYLWNSTPYYSTQEVSNSVESALIGLMGDKEFMTWKKYLSAEGEK